MKPYVVHLVYEGGGLSPAMVMASNQFEADEAAQFYEKNGIHVVSVEIYHGYM